MLFFGKESEHLWKSDKLEDYDPSFSKIDDNTRERYWRMQSRDNRWSDKVTPTTSRTLRARRINTAILESTVMLILSMACLWWQGISIVLIFITKCILECCKHVKKDVNYIGLIIALISSFALPTTFSTAAFSTAAFIALFLGMSLPFLWNLLLAVFVKNGEHEFIEAMRQREADAEADLPKNPSWHRPRGSDHL